MDKKQAYQELISDVKEYYKAQEATYKDDQRIIFPLLY